MILATAPSAKAISAVVDGLGVNGNLLVPAAPNEPESPETELPSGRTIVMMRSAEPENVTFAVARTETFVYVPAGTRMLTMCGSAERAAPEQSLPGLAPGRTVPVHVTLVLWPWTVGTVT